MNYELKSISPASVLFTALRISVVIGFIFAIPAFYMSSTDRLPFWWQKLAATFIFTFFYTVIASLLLTFMAWLYNAWAARFSGLKFHFEQTEE